MFLRLVLSLLLSLYTYNLWACNPRVEECRFQYLVSSSFIDYFSTNNLTIPNTAVTRLIIGIQGNERNAQSLIRTLYRASETEGAVNTTLIITPWLKANDFGGSTGCVSGVCDSVSDNEIFWSSDGWKEGDLSLSTLKMSSFQLIDQMISSIVNSNHFPNLRTVIITGHSAGGQFVQRYSVGTSIEQSLSPSIAMEYVSTNPSSYLYLDAKRPNWAGLFPKGGIYPSNGLNAASVTKPIFVDPYIRSVSPYQEVTDFNAITNGLNSASGSNCQCSGAPPCSYERYKYGFDIEPLNFDHYMCSNNAYQSCAEPTTTDTRISAYLNKKVTYILGQLDNSTLSGSVDANVDLDTSCGGNFQGPDRLSRGTFFYESLSRFGVHQHRLLIAPQVGHSSSQMYQSYQARKSLFGGDLPIKEYAAPFYGIKQKSNGRFLDALEATPFTSMTQTAQSDWTQNWMFTKVGLNEYRIQQQKTLRYLEASSTSTSVFTKDYSNSLTQIWILKPVPKEANVFTVQAKSTLRYLDAATNSDYLTQNQTQQFDNTQKWVITKK